MILVNRHTKAKSLSQHGPITRGCGRCSRDSRNITSLPEHGPARCRACSVLLGSSHTSVTTWPSHGSMVSFQCLEGLGLATVSPGCHQFRARPDHSLATTCNAAWRLHGAGICCSLCPKEAITRCNTSPALAANTHSSLVYT